MTDETAPSVNAAQIDYWNTLAGLVWVRFQAQLDRQIEPLGLAAMAALAPAPGETILDIGCGCGQTTVGLAAQLAPGGAVVGVDISEPMLEVARHRPKPGGGAPVTFRRADAQVDDLGREAFDAAFSRFGVMFFADPAAAFANIRAALKPGGRLAFVCWRQMTENPWMAAPRNQSCPRKTLLASVARRLDCSRVFTLKETETKQGFRRSICKRGSSRSCLKFRLKNWAGTKSIGMSLQTAVRSLCLRTPGEFGLLH